jgi:hypothetical protein
MTYILIICASDVDVGGLRGLYIVNRTGLIYLKPLKYPHPGGGGGQNIVQLKRNIHPTTRHKRKKI